MKVLEEEEPKKGQRKHTYIVSIKIPYRQTMSNRDNRLTLSVQTRERTISLKTKFAAWLLNEHSYYSRNVALMLSIRVFAN